MEEYKSKTLKNVLNVSTEREETTVLTSRDKMRYSVKLATLLDFRASYVLTVLNTATSCSLVAMMRLPVVVASLCLHRQEGVRVRHGGNT